MKKIVQIKILDERMRNYLPKYHTNGSAGLDLRVSLEGSIIIQPNDTIMIPTGLAVYIEDVNYAGIIIPRSGLGHQHGIILGNSIGLIDSDYQGQLIVSIWNRKKDIFVLEPMSRFAQLIVIPVIQVEWKEVETFSVVSQRGLKNFGSSGTA